tara:strand:- start:1629 stop:2402 length:774 start_codon:yes stop_codon:yes gene_type:complete
MSKRIFAFGCSMTRYRWPTWADIYASDKTTQFYNYAHSGAGNQFIANQIVETCKRFNWNDDDLILIMWSSITREDRYVTEIISGSKQEWNRNMPVNEHGKLKGGWLLPGNIYSQDLYDEEFVNQFSSEKGYLMRDLATIKLTESFLSNFKYKMFQMSPFECVDEDHNDEVYKIYDKPNYPCLLDCIGGEWPHIKCTYDNSYDSDRHPDPSMHFEFLRYAGMQTTDSMREFANKWQNKVSNSISHEEVGWDAGEVVRL